MGGQTENNRQVSKYKIMDISKFKSNWKKFRFFLPYLWPRTMKLQIYLFLAFILLGLTNLRNTYTLIFNKWVVDSLTATNDQELEFRWDLIALYVVMNYLRYFERFKDILWMKVTHNTSKEIQIGVFKRIQSLSLRWHMNRKTGEVLSILEKSSESFTGFLDTFYHSIIPTVMESLVSISYFMSYFDFWFGLTVAVCILLHIAITYYTSEWMSRKRRSNFKAAYEAKNSSIDSLMNFETVKYFGNEEYEVNIFKNAFEVICNRAFQGVFVDTTVSALKSLTVNISLLVGSLMCGYRIVTTKDLTIGDYVMFSSHVYSLFWALGSFSYFYGSIRDFITDMEQFYDLLKEEIEVKDTPNAAQLEINNASIVFQNVFFEYLPNQPILKNITFTVHGGKTTAIVGPSGSGKTTITRLLFRFYDVGSGSILIDGQNIKDVTQKSLRKAIGVVPQDTVLFNNTIRFNIKYGRLSADEEQIIEAAEGADIHKNIISFKDGYDTEVGERGLKLSGGEKQRIAIARTILKAPRIVLLDEATSSLDTKTERNIQKSLNKLCTNRTTIIIAHRLSTIIHAEQILVLKEGVIVERGRHDDLLKLDGLYASMWQLQMNSILENNDTKSKGSL
ncbi:hypothetical protein HHI36_021524 [Cryptolaemus montrouzieri]|uniref:ATP-binding cassette sub-family B member 6, mitochondrial n=1 Tax=Cryptolaemus montrouzieri TaxID=559131 RepID=A0ABD2MYE0_9CUCU